MKVANFDAWELQGDPSALSRYLEDWRISGLAVIMSCVAVATDFAMLAIYADAVYIAVQNTTPRRKSFYFTLPVMKLIIAITLNTSNSSMPAFEAIQLQQTSHSPPAFAVLGYQ
jgi:hypothetical protein